MRGKSDEIYRGKNNKMAKSSPSLLVFTKNVNGFNYPIKSHKLAGWIKKQDPVYKRNTLDIKTHIG